MKNIWIKGPRDGHVYREEYIYDYVDAALEILNLTDEWNDDKYDITITVFNKFPEDCNGAYGLCYGSYDDVEIDLSREDVTFDFMMQTLAHELIHAKQSIEGRTMYEAEAKKGELFLHETVKQRLNLLKSYN